MRSELKRLLTKPDVRRTVSGVLAALPPAWICDSTGEVLLGDPTPAIAERLRQRIDEVKAAMVQSAAGVALDGALDGESAAALPLPAPPAIAPPAASGGRLPPQPVEVDGDLLGWVAGEAAAVPPVTQLVAHLARREREKKALARETLERYKEIALLYTLGDRLATNLDLSSVAHLALDEARKLIASTAGAALLFDAETGKTEVLAQFGAEPLPDPRGGIVGAIVAAGAGEIVNDTARDPRWGPQERAFRSLACSPLRAKTSQGESRSIGAIVLGSGEPVDYTAADLKLLNALTAQAAAAIENARLHERELHEARIKQNLERYIPAQLVTAIALSNGGLSLAPVRKDIAILFSDIRNFTTHCESVPPEDIVRYLNEYFTYMVDAIFERQGTVNKFVGDAILALFGAPSPLPDSEFRAVSTAIAMQERLRTLPVQWIRERFHTGIGLTSGSAIVGNIGSPKHADYTAIGDEVNVAARLQSLAKGGQILVSRRVYDATRDRFEFCSFGSISVKGKRKPVEVFEVKY